MAEKIRHPQYQYVVTYDLNGKTTKQSINSRNPEANLALAEEALLLLVDANKSVTAKTSIRIISIQGVTDRAQVWPARQPNQGEGAVDLGEELNSVESVDPESVLTANGLPTPTAAAKYTTEQLQGLASILKIDTTGMKFPQLRKVVLEGLDSALKAVA